jgi:hypothetical protein
MLLEWFYLAVLTHGVGVESPRFESDAAETAAPATRSRKAIISAKTAVVMRTGRALISWFEQEARSENGK